MKKMTKKQLDLLVVTRDDDLLSTFPGYSRGALRKMKREEKAIRATNIPTVPVEAQVEMDEKVKKEKEKKQTVDKKYKFLLSQNEALVREREAFLAINKPVRSFKIKPAPNVKSEATDVYGCIRLAL